MVVNMVQMVRTCSIHPEGKIYNTEGNNITSKIRKLVIHFIHIRMINRMNLY